MSPSTLLLFLSFAFAVILSSAAPTSSHGDPTQVAPPPLEGAGQGTSASSQSGQVEVRTIQENRQQVGRTQATPTQTRMGRAASTPSKKVPHPCPGCFSVIGDPGTPPKAQ